MVKFQTFVALLTLIECAGIGLVIAIRCVDDPAMHGCSDLTGKSVSYLLDWIWLQNLAAVGLGGASVMNIFFSFWLLYPDYDRPFWGPHWYFWLLRAVHSLGFAGVATIGVFNVGTYEDIHMMAAFWLFIMLCFECVAVLFIPENWCNISKLFMPSARSKTEPWGSWTLVGFLFQIVHANLNWIFAVLYMTEDYGPYEWLGIWGILLYANWFSRDHWDDDITVLVRVKAGTGQLKQESIIIRDQHQTIRLLTSIHKGAN
jgi:hypothetical protein